MDQGGRERSLIRSFSDPADMTRGGAMASDAVESLLLLGQLPILSSSSSSLSSDEPLSIPMTAGLTGSRSESGDGNSSGSSGSSGHMMNYYQRMRIRNNEASKRARLKRRIKQESLEKTTMFLERQRNILGQRVARLHRIKQILAEACLDITRLANGETKDCRCEVFCTLIRETNRGEGEGDKRRTSNKQLIRESQILRKANLEEVIGPEILIKELKYMRRGPRRVHHDSCLVVDTHTGVVTTTTTDTSSRTALDLRMVSPAVQASKQETTSSISLTSEAAPGILSGGSKKPRVLAPRPAAHIQPHGVILSGSPSASTESNAAGRLPDVSSMLLPPSLSEFSLSCLSATNTILLTPLSPSLPSRLMTLPFPSARTTNLPNPFLGSVSPVAAVGTGLPFVAVPSSPLVAGGASVTDAAAATEERKCEVVSPPASPPQLQIVEDEKEDVLMDSSIKSESDLEIAELDEMLDLPDETYSRCMAAQQSFKTRCSGEVLDVNQLNQTLDLLTMQPKSPGPLTAAEKYIIKSRLGEEFWRSEEKPAFICTHHRHEVVHGADTSCCSRCNRKRGKKGAAIITQMFIVTYRMALEFYMTKGEFLHIGLLVCSVCRYKTLKGLDFGDSQCLDDSSMDVKEPPREPPQVAVAAPAKQAAASRPSVFFKSASRGKMATILPQPQNPLAALVKSSSFGSQAVGSTSNSSLARSNSSSSISSLSSISSSVSSVQATAPAVQTPAASNRTIFSKIKDLNQSLREVNPQYRPLGFSVTSLEALSPAVLEDALEATSLALQTVLTTIAPGQEKQLWEAVRGRLDANYGGQQAAYPAAFGEIRIKEEKN